MSSVTVSAGLGRGIYVPDLFVVIKAACSMGVKDSPFG